jgi:hypothetical protein
MLHNSQIPGKKTISAPLGTLISNEYMREAKEGLATLEDVEDTFVGFCEFAHTGDHFSLMTERRHEVGNNVAAPIEEEEARDKTAVDWEVPQAEGVAPR